MSDQTVPIFIFIIVGLLCGVVPLLIGVFLSPKCRSNSQKNAPYECGFEPFKNARVQFDVRFYLLAVLFIIFDLEMVFLFPFAVAFREIPIAGLIGMGLFVLLIAVGFVVEWQKGALEWE